MLAVMVCTQFIIPESGNNGHSHQMYLSFSYFTFLTNNYCGKKNILKPYKPEKNSS